jgi:hypothetical protein
MAFTLQVFPDVINGVKACLKDRRAVELARHFPDKPIEDAPKNFNDSIGVFFDMEWTNGKPKHIVTEGSLSIFPMKHLADCKTQADFNKLMRKFSVNHMRIVETCYMRAKGKDHFGITFKNAELNPQFYGTRFVTAAQAIDIIKSI